MKSIKFVLGLTAGLLATVALSSTGAVAQEEPLEVQLGSGSTISNPRIRFVEAREEAFKNAANRNNAPVATIYSDSNTTTGNALSYSNRLHGIGVGANSQVARALCAIESTEVDTRQTDLDMVEFHLEKVAGLLAEVDPNGAAVDAAVRDTSHQDRNAMYQSMQASMETTNCVPDSVNAAIDESEATRLGIAWTAREHE